MLTKEDLSIYKITSKDTVRPILMSVQIKKVKQDNHWYIRLAATDGYRLTQKLVPVDYEPTFEELLIPAATLQDLCKQLNKDRRVLIANSQFQILNTKVNPEGLLERTVSMGETVEGKFPEYEGLIPSGEPKSITKINPKYMKDMMLQHGDDAIEMKVHDKLQGVVITSTNTHSVETTSIIMPLKP